MMDMYYVKQELWGVRKGSVERFARHKAAQLVIEGKIEPYDPKRHASAPGAPPKAEDDRKK